MCTIYLPKDKIVDASAVSRPLYKIEDCLTIRSKKLDTSTNTRISRATKEQMIAKEQTRVEDTVEVIDRLISACDPLNITGRIKYNLFQKIIYNIWIKYIFIRLISVSYFSEMR